MRNICDIYAFISTNNDLLSTRNYFFQEVSSYLLEDKSEDTKGLIRRLKSKKDIQYNTKRKGTIGQTTIYKPLYKKLKKSSRWKAVCMLQKPLAYFLKALAYVS